MTNKPALFYAILLILSIQTNGTASQYWTQSAVNTAVAQAAQMTYDGSYMINYSAGVPSITN
jgi:hypothetical protein